MSAKKNLKSVVQTFLKVLIYILLPLVVFLNLAQANPVLVKKPTKYPFIFALTGDKKKIFLTNKDNQTSSAQNQYVLTEKATLRTSPGTEVFIQLDESRSIHILEDSEVLLLAINWPEGRCPLVVIKSGSVRWRQDADSAKAKYNIAAQSDLFEFIVPAGHYQFSFFPQKALAEARVYFGVLNFSATNAEESVTLKAGQQVGFQGILENGQISYDVLLHGKKIPRGNLTAVSSVSPSDMQRFSETAIKAKQQQEQKALALAKAKKEADRKKAGYICTQPDGIFNQVVLIKNKKQRCNANGQWQQVDWE
ncbi:MAG: hypothetical protein ACOYOK_05465 [Pseudobdellovibrionaceae bacterium]